MSFELFVLSFWTIVAGVYMSIALGVDCQSPFPFTLHVSGYIVWLGYCLVQQHVSRVRIRERLQSKPGHGVELL